MAPVPSARRQCAMPATTSLASATWGITLRASTASAAPDETVAEHLTVGKRALRRPGHPHVVREKQLRIDRLGELDRSASVAPADDEREGRLHLRSVAAEAVRKRLAAEIEHGRN